MKKLVTLVIFCAIFPLATALDCTVCHSPITSTTCKPMTSTCFPSYTKCFKGILKASGTVNNQITAQACTIPDLCTAPMSVNTGSLRVTGNLDCCNSDNCNTNTKIPAPYTDITPNDSKCYFCDGTECSKIMYCQGVENRCFETSAVVNGKTQPLKGCASDNACKTPPSDLEFIFGTKFKSSVICCTGNLCNNAKRTEQSVFVLLVPLTSIKLFY
ncbi:phospholipase A2 inhibitor and Ly6/PLAUR domain-containing protein-like [Lepisosteus oculatus]|uniref:phospholipase A2 inhibitor and Ly6/PLAUR domain-containing protein-like n=1 Tax=Lepisosteus oculatus TaxID=7918 RepID=UPI0007403633|nr:PREDICTED: phospholipase A2 inhibitor and Ly6/PLAUR domain-containing protein-like [Lepisosteus oculatus]